MYHIDRSAMQLIINGASFLASGGGGGVASATEVMNNVLGYASTVSVVSSGELEDAAQPLVICGVGAPDAPQLNFQKSPGYALQGMQAMTGKRYTHVLPIEVGAMNSMIPLLACAQLGLPFVDADGAGRSVPQMSMCTYALQGFNTRNTLVVSEEDDQYPLHPANAMVMEQEVRQVVSSKLSDAGTVATWGLTGHQVKQPGAVVSGSLALARRVGAAMASNAPLASVKALVDDYYPASRVMMAKAQVLSATNKVEDGFDVGTLELQDCDNPDITVTLYFVNESLLALVQHQGQPAYAVLGPDMICSMGVDGTPMTNYEIYQAYSQGQTVQISLMYVQAVKSIRVPEMFFLYLSLLAQKFGAPDIFSRYPVLGAGMPV